MATAGNHNVCKNEARGRASQMTKMWCVAALAWVFATPTLAQGLRDAPVPAAISLVEENGALKFRDDGGQSLYIYDRDPAGSSVCVGLCASEWPPVVAPQDAHPLGDWTPIRRTDGSLQWAYKGKPVYTYRGDTEAGQANGAERGGVWHVLAP
jgi:predicted lipoprotein with Yx(FWY)xxD motif